MARWCIRTALMLTFLTTGIAGASASLGGEEIQNYYERQNWRFINNNHLLPTPVPVMVDQVFGIEPEEETAPSREKTRLVVNVPSREVTIYSEETVCRRYPVGVGSTRYKTPIGGQRFLSRIIWNPWWLPPDSAWAKNSKKTPPGPYNPLGKAKMPLGNAILLHGTNKPHTVGQTRSHGCLRMKNQDVTELAWWIQKHFSEKSEGKHFQKYQSTWRRSFHVPLATKIPVTIDYQRVEVRGDDLLIHPNVYYRSSAVAWNQLHEELSRAGIELADVDFERLPDNLTVQETTTIPLQSLFIDSEGWLAQAGEFRHDLN